MPIKSVKMKISKNKKMHFFLMSQGSFNPKIRFLGQKVCSVARLHTDTHKSDMGTLSGFQEFFLQPIIKDRPNNVIQVWQAMQFRKIMVSVWVEGVRKWKILDNVMCVYQLVIVIALCQRKHVTAGYKFCVLTWTSINYLPNGTLNRLHGNNYKVGIEPQCIIN